MWCSNCRQDVRALKGPRADVFRCARCQRPLNPDDAAQPGNARAAFEETPPPKVVREFEDWKVDQDVLRLRARVDLAAKTIPRARRISPPRKVRLDARHWGVPRPQMGRRYPVRQSATAAKAVLSAGTVCFMWGALLLAWSLMQDRFDLWSLGIPGVVGGQVLLLLGLALQLDYLWHNSHFTIRQLDHVDHQLDQLERTTNLLSATHGTASQAFYSHMAGGANPQLLASDLQGQVDLLARQIARRA